MQTDEILRTISDYGALLSDIDESLGNLENILQSVKVVKGKSRPSVKIRTLTGFVSFSRDSKSRRKEFVAMCEFLVKCKKRFQEYGFEVQTLRIACQKWEEFLPLALKNFQKVVKQLDSWVASSEVWIVTLGPCNSPELTEHIKWALCNTSNLYFSTSINDEKMLEPSADIMKFVGQKTKNGHGNFKFTASAACPPLIPYAPACYHASKQPCFAIGLENSKLFYETWDKSTTWENATSRLKDALEERCKVIENIALSLEDEDVWYGGIDTSICPFVDSKINLITPIENLLQTTFGSVGTLSAIKCITQALKTIDCRRTGYCGMMLPCIEDTGLAKAAMQGNFDIQSLIKYSSVCGVGLDVIPLPLKTSKECLVRLLRDLRTLALTLDKPLSCRLMLVPEVDAGDVFPKFNEWSSDTRVFDLK